VKFVNAVTNVEVTNGIFAATRGGTSLISGYTSYSAAKLGFQGTYSAISAALSSLTWTPSSVSNGVSIRIGISSAPATNEFYDANSSHYYRFVSTPRPWADARTAAEATRLFGLQGYLAEINTEAENAFIAKETSANNIWIGAREDDTTTATYRGSSYSGSAGQRWIWNGAVQNPLPVGTGLIAQGAPAAYSSWSPTSGGEPNNDLKPGADCAVTNWGTKGLWNDLPCRNGYSYLIEFGGRPNETSTASAATLTATITATNPVQYTVTYNPNSGNSTPTQASRTKGQTFNLADAITRSPSGGISYQFAGWESGGNSYGARETITVQNVNLTFTAAWIQLYEVTYVSNGGTFAGSETNKDSECPSNICSNDDPITLNSTPTRSGYTFDGWKDQNGNFVTDTNGGVAGIQTTVTSNRYIFTASWTLISYTITYISSGSTAPTQSSLNSGVSFAVGSEASKVGNRFDGWSDGNLTYWPNDDYLVVNSNITLTAQWTPTYAVTYSQGLGTGTPPVDPSILLQGNIFEVFPGTDISRTGFTFGGWSDGTSTYQAGSIYTVGASNISLTAQWVAAQGTNTNTIAPGPTFWTITFDRNGANSGNPPTALRVVEKSSVAITLPGNIGRTTTSDNKRPMLKRGFTFAGWSTSNSGVTPLPALFTPTSSVTLYAIWEAIPAAKPEITPTPTPSPTPKPVADVSINAQPSVEMRRVSMFYFALGSYVVTKSNQEKLRTIAAQIMNSPAKTVLIYGHTDSLGGVNNLILSKNRANAIANQLRPLLKGKTIRVGWFAASKPAVQGKTNAANAKNRRVEIWIK
jgi:uncharacterized repeat protein (TIGR02543 family)